MTKVAPRRWTARLGCGAALLAILLLAGCESPPWPWNTDSSSSVYILPSAVVVPAGMELKYAEEYAAGQGNCEALFGIGPNRVSYYKSPTALVIQRATYPELRKGMLVVFLSRSGWRSAGILVDEDKYGWHVLGPKDTPTAIVNEDNLIGFVITAFSSDSMPKRD